MSRIQQHRTPWRSGAALYSAPMFEGVLDQLGSWPWSVGSLAVGLVFLLAGGHVLVEAAITLAKRLHVSPLVIGMTIVSFGTSAPELAFNIIAAVNDNSDLSFGNIVGSNIANIGLVLGLAALVTPLAVHHRLVKTELPVLIAISLGMAAMALWLPRVQTESGLVPGFARVDGLIMLALFGLFIAAMLRLSRKGRADLIDRDVAAALEKPVEGGRSVIRASLAFFAGLLILLGGGKFAELGAVGVAEKIGLSQAAIALTVVAVATSLPEVVTSLVAARKGEVDLAVGNVLGSNIFNILLVLGATSVIAPVQIPRFGGLDLTFMCALTVLLAGLVFVGRRRVTRGSAIILLALYAGYIAFTLLRRTLLTG